MRRHVVLSLHAPSGTTFDVEVESDETGFTFDMPVCDEQDEEFIRDAVAGFFIPAITERVTLRFDLENFKQEDFPEVIENPGVTAAAPVSRLVRFVEFVVAMIAPRTMLDGLLGDILERHARNTEKFGPRRALAIFMSEFLWTVLNLLKSRLVTLIGFASLLHKLWRMF